MAGQIKHKWSGTTLIITSDSGTSSCDLKGEKGDMGVRGAQGVAGVLTDPTGALLADANNYYQKEQTDDLIANTNKTINAEVAALSNQISANEKRITNLEHGSAPIYFETDSAAAYVKDVPEGALPYAEIERIGGYTKKSKNLIPFPYTETRDNLSGVTFTVSDNGVITRKGTSINEWNNFVLTKSADLVGGKTYTLSPSMTISYKDTTGATQYFSSTFTWNSDYQLLQVYISIAPNSTYNDTLYPMLNEGASALPYEIGFEGLRNAAVTEVKTVGKNLSPVASITTQESAAGSFGIDGITKHGYYTLSADITKYADDTSTNTRATIAIVYTDGTKTEKGCAVDTNSAESDGVPRRKTVTVQTDSTKTIASIWLTILNYSVVNNRNAKAENIQVEYSSAATEYAPYKADTLTIPQEVQELEAYGAGLSADCYNYLDLENNKYTKMAQRLVLDGETEGAKVPYVGLNSDSGLYYWVVTLEKDANINNPTACVSSRWVTSDKQEAGTLFLDAALGKTALVIYPYDNSLNTVEAANNYLAEQYASGKPVTVIYELNTPEFYEINALDNFIEVEGSGTVTMVNEHNYNMPNEITFMLKE